MIKIICRLWHGWTSIENSDLYESLLREKILPNIHRVKGYKGAQLLRRTLDRSGETEFITITYFESIEAVVEFAGQDYGKAVVPDDARKLLLRFDESSFHYNLVFDDTCLFSQNTVANE